MLCDDCTEGFMEESYLSQKSSQICNSECPVGSGLSLLEEGTWIMDKMKIKCTSSITLSLGVDVRTGDDNRNQYPSLMIWIKNGKNHYDLHISEEIILDPSGFVTDGVFNYTFSIPSKRRKKRMNIEYLLGIKQPGRDVSRVRFYHYNDDDAKNILKLNNPSSHHVHKKNDVTKRKEIQLLIYPHGKILRD